MTDLSQEYLVIGLLVMTLGTYAVRVAPLLIFRKKIESRWLTSFLYYVPYAVLSAMTFPAIFSATDNTVSSIVGTVIALVLAFFDRSLITVALGAAAGAFITGLIVV